MALASDGAPAVLLASAHETILQHGGRSISLGALEGARMVVDPTAIIHVAGLRADGLSLVRVDKTFSPQAARLATIRNAHPAAGVDLAWTPEGIRIVAPGPGPRTMAVYTDTPEAQPLALTIHAWSHPLLRYNAIRKRLHLVFCPWSDSSAIYDTVYYLRSDDHGASWLNAGGTKHELPLQPTAREQGYERPCPENVSIIGQPAGGHSNTLAHCLEVDPDGHPHILYSFNRPYHLGREPFMRCVRVGWDGAKWKFGELAADFAVDAAGGCLDIVDKTTMRTLLMFKDRKIPGLELGISKSTDGGQTWGAILPLTLDAKIKSAHYVAPNWVKRGTNYEFVCAGFNQAPSAPVYQGTIDERLFE